MLDDILTHFDKQTKPDGTNNHNGQIEEDTPVNIMSDTQQKDANTNLIAINTEQNEDPN